MASLFICGDVLNYNQANGEICSTELAKIVSSADYSVCNFEAPIGGYGSPQPKSGPHHFSRPETIKGIKQQGFDLLLLANNHIMDYGKAALHETIDRAVKLQLDTIGAGPNSNEAYRPLIKKIGDIKVGMINACEAQFGVLDYFEKENKAGYAWINHHFIDQNILKLKNLCDFVVVFSHAGLEHYPLPQKEWRARYKHFCDIGADIVVGSHPHIPQGYEKHKNSLIFYSLGNFYFDSKNFVNKDNSSFALLLELTKNKPPGFQLIYHYQKDFQVHLAPKEKQADVAYLNRLLGESYNAQSDQMSLSAYRKIKKNLTYSLSPVPYDGGLKSSVRRMLRVLCRKGKKVDKEQLLLHLLRNEAYYYAARHALEIIVLQKQQK